MKNEELTKNLLSDTKNPQMITWIQDINQRDHI